jgi:hypothetical protein
MDGFNMRTSLLTLFILALLSFFHRAEAQIKIVPREQLEALANPRHSPDSAWLKFDSRHIDGGQINEDDAPVTFRYAFVNEGPAEVSIKRLVSTCSCAVAVCDRKTVGPGESAQITLTYDPKGHPGTFLRRVFVYTQEGTSPAAILSLAVNVGHKEDYSTVFQHQMGGIRLRRKEVSFNEGVQGVEKIPFINLSGKDLQLECDKAMLPSCLQFSVEPKVIPDRGEGEIIITFKPSEWKASARMAVMLKNLGVAPSRSSILVNVLKGK